MQPRSKVTANDLAIFSNSVASELLYILRRASGINSRKTLASLLASASPILSEDFCRCFRARIPFPNIPLTHFVEAYPSTWLLRTLLNRARTKTLGYQHCVIQGLFRSSPGTARLPPPRWPSSSVAARSSPPRCPVPPPASHRLLTWRRCGEPR